MAVRPTDGHQRNGIPELVQQRVEADVPSPGCGELDAQRNAVYQLADPLHQALVELVGPSRAVERSRPIKEELHRWRAAGRGAGERLDRPHLLPVDVERVAAGGKDVDAVRRLNQEADQGRRALGDVFAVVHDQQQVPIG